MLFRIVCLTYTDPTFLPCVRVCVCSMRGWVNARLHGLWMCGCVGLQHSSTTTAPLAPTSPT